MKRGLLLGAGFSYNLGMPLAKKFSEYLYSFLTEERLREIAFGLCAANPYGADRPLDRAAMSAFCDCFEKQRACFHYEGFLSAVEDMPLETQAQRDARSCFLGKIKELIEESFFLCQTGSAAAFLLFSPLYHPLFRDLKEEMWVLSLNHDLAVEMLCIQLGIPVCFGASEQLTFPLRNEEGAPRIQLDAADNRAVSLAQLDFAEGRPAVNLLKIHGGLNEFFYQDRKRRLYLPVENCGNPLDYIAAVGTVMHDMHYCINGVPVRIQGEYAVCGPEGEWEFLQPSVLSGGHKYSLPIQPRVGEEKISLMSEVLDRLEELVICGYSFCDRHINDRICRAMHRNDAMKIWIVDPGLREMPDCLRPFDYGMRVRRVAAEAPDWIHYETTGTWRRQAAQLHEAERQILAMSEQKIAEIFAGKARG